MASYLRGNIPKLLPEVVFVCRFVVDFVHPLFRDCCVSRYTQLLQYDANDLASVSFTYKCEYILKQSYTKLCD